MRILLLDPDEYYHHQFRQRLSGEFELMTARSLVEAADLLESSAPDVVVAELLLEDGPSFSLLSKLAKGKNVPVIVFSAVNHLEDIQETLARGASGYFVKGRNTINEVHQLLLNFNQ